MSSMPEIIIQEFSDTSDAFLRYGRKFFQTNDAYRGYVNIEALLNEYDLSKYDLYEAVVDGAVAGVAGVRVSEETLYFDIFTVDDEFRGIGVGDALFSEIINDKKYANATKYESMALPGDRSTKNFFEQRQGKARLLIVGGPIKRD